MPENDEGTYADLEGEDNAIDVSNPEYIGVNPEYKNDAYGLGEPLPSEDPATAAIEDRAKKYEADYTGIEVNAAGYTPGPHKAGTGTKVEAPEAEAPAEAPAEAEVPAEAEAPAEAPAAEGGDGADDGAAPPVVEAPVTVVAPDPSVATGFYAPPAPDDQG